VVGLMEGSRGAQCVAPDDVAPAAYVLPIGIACTESASTTWSDRVLGFTVALVLLGAALLGSLDYLPRYSAPCGSI